jgi:D-alanyl-D-alanine carboxypeptidase
MSLNHPKRIAVLFILAAIIGLSAFLILSNRDKATLPQTVPNSEKKTETTNPAAFDKNQFSIDGPSSLWTIVNKKRPLAAGYVPGDMASVGGSMLKSDAAAAVNQLIAAAGAQQVPLKVISGYRSYQTQKSVYDSYVQKDGQAAADTYSARPGHSEHQTGLAADLGNSNGNCDLEICFESTPGGKWMAAHAHEYGFIIRYASDKTAITGYQFEPWHIRYVGKDLAAQLHAGGQTMEEFFGLPAAPGY